jgi:tRNA (guanine26-N2/guanine27-N2)-dimethyltransferase
LNDLGLSTVREGITELLVPQGFNKKGPGSRTGEVFYNKQMEFGRDVSVMLGRAVFREGQKVLDGLAATGARGLRLANECGVKAEFIMNDRNLAAAVLMKQNAALNSLGHVRIECRDLRSLLADEQFDYIDVDPFGPPVDFIDGAVQSCRNNGMIAITATDTAPLYGTYPKTCLRRYGALSQRSPFAHETGLRILAGYVIRQAAVHDRAATPVLCYHADHYFRCYLRVRNGAERADALVQRLGYANYDPKTLSRSVGEERRSPRSAGPLWTGDLFSKDLLRGMKASGDLGTAARCDRMLDSWREEAGSPALFYSMDELARKTKLSPPRLVDFVEYLRKLGAEACRTHLDPKAVKTDMSAAKLVNAYRRYRRGA